MRHRLHWSDRPLDDNIRKSKFWSLHINRPRISADTIYKLLKLKNELQGTKLDILRESDRFEESPIL